MRNEFWASVARHLDGLVHEAVGSEPVEIARHRSFIGTNLGAGLIALIALPVFLAFIGPTGFVEATVLAGLAAPAPIALYVSRTGRIAHGHMAIAVAATVTVCLVAALTGGLGSYALFWLTLVPIEATLSGSRRIVTRSTVIALSGLVALLAASLTVGLPAPVIGALPPEVAIGLTTMCALVYAGTLAARVDFVHRTSENLARARSDHYRILSENITDIVTGHAPNGDILFVSPAVERELGLTAKTIAGDGLFRRVHVADRPAYLKALSDAMSEPGSGTVEFRVRLGELDAPAHDQHWVWLEMSARPISEPDPITGMAVVVSVTRNVSERKAHEEQLRRAHEAAEEASLAKTRFLANVSHELRTPLNAIIGFSDMLQSEIFGRLPDNRQREYVRLIHESGTHLLQVVNDILDMSKIEAGKFDIVVEPFETAALIHGTRDMMSGQAEAGGIELVADVAVNLGEMIGDRRAIKQVLINLMSNAIKFTRPGGRVTLGVRRDGDFAAYYVRDTGVGIDAKDLPRLGTPFVQADSGYDRRHEGTGLGLSMVKGIAELHGGRFEIESQLGSGTCVTVHIPLNSEKVVRGGRDGAQIHALAAADAAGPRDRKNPSAVAPMMQKRA
ncbi:MAG: PAS domain S-box protein [Hyphomicrobiaceae bacterium]|nr:PAS domain S-box protein [Hyphomicrobiaceae bacterium]